MLACFRVHPEAKTQTLSKQKKDLERLRRDASHGIMTTPLYRLLQLRDRLVYRLALACTDALYREKYRRSSPYREFLG